MTEVGNYTRTEEKSDKQLGHGVLKKAICRARSRCIWRMFDGLADERALSMAAYV